jgi:serine/threonine protein kinase
MGACKKSYVVLETDWKHLSSEWKVLDWLGSGEFGRTDLVQDPRTKKKYAVKHVKTEEEYIDEILGATKDKEDLKQAKSLFKILYLDDAQEAIDIEKESYIYLMESGINFVPCLLGYGDDFLILEAVEGKDFDTALASTYTVKGALKLVIKLFEHIKTLHTIGFAACDIHSANVKVKRGKVTLLDFGLSATQMDPADLIACGQKDREFLLDHLSDFMRIKSEKLTIQQAEYLEEVGRRMRHRAVSLSDLIELLKQIQRRL